MPKTVKDVFIQFRVKEDDKKLVYRAASIMGYSVSDFTRESILKVARQVVRDAYQNEQGSDTGKSESEGQGQRPDAEGTNLGSEGTA